MWERSQKCVSSESKYSPLNSYLLRCPDPAYFPGGQCCKYIFATTFLSCLELIIENLLIKDSNLFLVSQPHFLHCFCMHNEPKLKKIILKNTFKCKSSVNYYALLAVIFLIFPLFPVPISSPFYVRKTMKSH